MDIEDIYDYTLISFPFLFLMLKIKYSVDKKKPENQITFNKRKINKQKKKHINVFID